MRLRIAIVVWLSSLLLAGCSSTPTARVPGDFPPLAPDAAVQVYLDPASAPYHVDLDVIETSAIGGDLLLRTRFERATERAQVEARKRGGDCVLLLSRKAEDTELKIQEDRRIFVPQETCRWVVAHLAEAPDVRGVN